MSKKKKNKFKKSKHSAGSGSHSDPSIAHAPSEQALSDDPQAEDDNQSTGSDKIIEAPKEIDHRYDYVKKDVGKLLLAIFGLVVLTAVIYFLNQQFLFLQSLGDWIYKIGNFQV